VCAALEAKGMRCWIAPRDIIVGRGWGESIVHALDQCPVLIVVLTANANRSRHVVREVERADSKGAWIIPLKLAAVELNKSLEYFLSATHWLDATRPPLDSCLDSLAHTVAKVLATGRLEHGTARETRSKTPARPVAEVVREFNEFAPDDWGRRAPRKGAGLFRALFED
jgi:hypothetical protein